jgi:hypothetical protein
MISLPEKPESFQSLLLDPNLNSKHLVNSLHIIAPAALPVPVVLVPLVFPVLLLVDILWHVAMPDTSFSPLVHHCSRI